MRIYIYITMLARYGFRFNVRYGLACERDSHRRELAATQHDTAFVAADMQFLVGDTCKNVAEEFAEGEVDSEPAIIPHFDEISTGFPCTNRTTQSSTSKQYVNCIQQATGETGGGYRLAESIIVKHSPDAGTLENVMGCAQAHASHVPSCFLVFRIVSRSK